MDRYEALKALILKSYGKGKRVTLKPTDALLLVELIEETQLA